MDDIVGMQKLDCRDQIEHQDRHLTMREQTVHLVEQCVQGEWIVVHHQVKPPKAILWVFNCSIWQQNLSELYGELVVFYFG